MFPRKNKVFLDTTFEFGRFYPLKISLPHMYDQNVSSLLAPLQPYICSSKILGKEWTGSNQIWGSENLGFSGLKAVFKNSKSKTEFSGKFLENAQKHQKEPLYPENPKNAGIFVKIENYSDLMKNCK